ncbi:origin recognition complex subunit 1 [Teleopsis dalmanni]|uniref:origin recognition complex subunit 1 n=1 Tax=Teleopsis dalmanni TaxID=139649 RepID=UPI0018CDFF4B|nr:origin recognition complex subunit 1 [Teleopsis dalmanni]
MVIKELFSSNVSVKWIGSQALHFEATNLKNKNVSYYTKCIIGALTLSVGDFVLVSNADAAEPDTVEGCDIAKIICLYELHEDMCKKDPYRACVQWYSRPQCIPHKEFDTDNINIDFNCEVIEEHRPYDADISLETIFRKCLVVIGEVEDTASKILNNLNSSRSTCPMFVCRYKFIKVKQYYRLVPLQYSEEPLDIERNTVRKTRRNSCFTESTTKVQINNDNSRRVRSAHKEKSRNTDNIKRRRASMCASSALEFVDISQFSTENKVSPIKIIGGRSVVKLSAKKKKEEVNANYLITSPLTEKNHKVPIHNSRASAARRNLNLSLEKEGNVTADSDCLNYSIVKPVEDEPSCNNEIKIKLRISETRRSNKFKSIDEDPLALADSASHEDTQSSRKRLGIIDNSTPNIYKTPSKKSKDTDINSEMTPRVTATRRKSILKSATSRPADGTPKRSIQLSNIVERRIFNDNDIVSTPKRSRNTKNDNVDVETPKTPKRSSRKSDMYEEKTPSKRSSMTATQKLKLLRSGELSPTIEKRITFSSKQNKNDLQLAREQLHVSVVPKSLPCREKEFENIYTFLRGKIEDQCGGCMYVSGVPGTGKTATTTGVIRTLQREATEENLPPFDYIEINGMRLTEPRQAYVQIYKQLTGKTVSWEHAHTLLEKRFTTSAPRRVTTVLLVDELDILCNRRQDVVYNLLDWPTKSQARLVVVTIANTMDLPERLLMGKVTSRLGLTRLTFQPYTHKQLQEIVTERLSGSDAFKSDAVQLVARKVAAVSGDARRALDICRRATEIADASFDANNKTKLCVNMAHVQQALGEMIASAKVQSIKNCSRLEQLFLQAVVAEITRTGVDETNFMSVYLQIETIAAFMGVTVPTPGRALRICSKLGSERLIICEHSRNDIFQKILLNVSMDDIHYALRVNTES